MPKNDGWFAVPALLFQLSMAWRLTPPRESQRRRTGRSAGGGLRTGRVGTKYHCRRARRQRHLPVGTADGGATIDSNNIISTGCGSNSGGGGAWKATPRPPAPTPGRRAERLLEELMGTYSQTGIVQTERYDQDFAMSNSHQACTRNIPQESSKLFL